MGRHSITEIRQAIEGSGGNISTIADRLSVTRQTIYRNIRRYPELQAALDAEGAQIEKRPQRPLDAVLKAIEGSAGNKSEIARRLNCTRDTVDNYIREWEPVRVAFENERESLVDRAESVIHLKLAENDADMAKFVVSRMGKNRGWDARNQVTGKDGEALFAPDVLDLARRMGFDMSAVVREFEEMVRAAAVEQ